MSKIKNYVSRGIKIGLAALVLYGGVSVGTRIQHAMETEKCIASEMSPDLFEAVYELPSNGEPKRAYLLVDFWGVRTFVDEKPFGSLDYMVYRLLKSPKFVIRNPTSDDYTIFTRLEKKAVDDGMIR